MRRGVTVLVVVTVGAIALAAGIDALRGGSELEPASKVETGPPASSTSTDPEPIQPASDELGGTLYYTDEACELRAIQLPGQTPAEAPTWDECRFVLSPDATSVSGAGSAWDPTGDHLFRADGGRIVVLSSDHEPEGSFSGAAASWRQDGTLTYFAEGAVRTWPRGAILLSQDDLAEAVRAHPFVPDQGHVQPVAVKELAWIDKERAVAVLAGVIGRASPETILAFFDGHRLTSMRSEGGLRMSGLRVSSSGSYVALKSGESLLMLDTRGDVLPAPHLSGYRAIAWSPGERWIAAATGRGTAVFPTGEPSVERQLPILAHDLVWR
jgi:hypothetical protein